MVQRGIPLPAANIKDPATRQVVQAMYEDVMKLRDELDAANLLADYRANTAQRSYERHRNPYWPIGATGDIEVQGTDTMTTIVLQVVEGRVVNFSGRIDALDPATRLTLTLNVDAGTIIPSTSFLAFHPGTRTTRLVTTHQGRIISI